MISQIEPLPIVLVDDDEDDRQFVREAMDEGRLANPLVCLGDGEELLVYLGLHDREAAPGRPGLILLDLNMPRMDGHESLGRLKANPALRSIPVVVLTTSKAQKDILRSYDLGANSHVTKPMTFAELVLMMKDLKRYWFEIVDLPATQETRGNRS